MVLAISVDSTWANKAFREQLGAEFPILSDARHEVSQRYGVFDDEHNVARRTTFVIDREGIVQHLDQDRDALDPSAAVGVCQRLSQ